MLREKGVVGEVRRVLRPRPRRPGLADRATIGNMSPEFGSTCAIFPVDAETLRYLEFTGRPTELIELVDAYAREQGTVPRRRTPRTRPTPTPSSSTSATSSRASPARSGPRTGSRWRAPSRPSSRRWRRRTPRRPKQLGSGYDEAVAESFPASDPPGEDAQRRRAVARASAGQRQRAVAERETADAIEVTLEDGTDGRARPRPGRDRGDHQLHQHLEPVGDGRRRPAGQQRGRARPASASRGSRPRWRRARRSSPTTSTSPGLDRVPRTSSSSTSSATAARPASATPGPLPEEISKAVEENDLVVCAVLSGNRNFEGRINQDVQGQLPRLAAAGRRLRAGRPHGHRPDQRAARRGLRRRAGLPARHLARPRGDQAGGRRVDPLRDVHQELRRGLQGRRAAGTRSRSRRATATPGPTRPTSAAPPSSRGCRPSRSRSSRSRAPGSWRCSATRSPPTTSRRPGRSRRTARPGAG